MCLCIYFWGKIYTYYYLKKMFSKQEDFWRDYLMTAVLVMESNILLDIEGLYLLLYEILTQNEDRFPSFPYPHKYNSNFRPSLLTESWTMTATGFSISPWKEQFSVNGTTKAA